MDDSIGDPSRIKLGLSFTSGDFLRFLNTADGTITFRGEAFALQPIVDAVGAILTKASGPLASAGRPAPPSS